MEVIALSTLRILTVPTLCFAHTFFTDNYEIVLDSGADKMEITFITEGRLTITQNDRTETAETGDFIINTYCAPLTVSSNASHRHHTICFLCKYTDMALPLVLHPATVGSHCQTLIAEIIRTRTLYPHRESYCIGLFFQLVDELEYMYAQSRRASQYSPYVNQAKKYIYDHIYEPIRQTDIAENLGITPEYLCTVFKKCEGISLIPYINRIKLDNIRIIMFKEKLSLQQASALFGYNDPNYVSRLYKRLFGYNITDPLHTVNLE